MVVRGQYKCSWASAPLVKAAAAVPGRMVAQLGQQLRLLREVTVVECGGVVVVVAVAVMVVQRAGGARLVSVSEAVVVLGQQEVVRQRVHGQRAPWPGGLADVAGVDVEGGRARQLQVVVLRVVVCQAPTAARDGVPSWVQHPRQVLQVRLQGPPHGTLDTTLHPHGIAWTRACRAAALGSRKASGIRRASSISCHAPAGQG